MKVSFIATVLNEGDNIEKLLKSLMGQSRKADEIIIDDGGSIDDTLSAISNFKLSIPNTKIKVMSRKGNRAVGRNEAVKNASGDIIVCSDAGCILDKNWIKSIIKPFKNPNTDVVAGYYKSKATNIFEKCITPYFLVMEDRINVNNFLPATRSMAFRKSIWKKVGGFPEEFSDNEDYVFAHKLKYVKAKIVFEKEAIVYWFPKRNLREAFLAFYKFAFGDLQALILRPKVIFLFIRYFIFFWLMVFFITTKFLFMWYILLILAIIYIFWAILKNFKYVNNLKALYYLPIIQITSDIAVISGTATGIFS